MPKRWTHVVLLTAAMFLLPSGAEAQGRNILLLIADDLGIDVAEIYPEPDRLATSPPAPPMPNLNRLAASGVLFRNAWSNPGCSPTRATIFTGRYGFRTGVGTALVPEEPNLPVLPIHEFGLPKAFAARPELGYVLAHVGKWHLSHGADDPNRYGWPYFAGRDPSYAGNQTVGPPPAYFAWPKTVNGITKVSTTYGTTDLVDEAAGVIDRAEGEQRPWFLWVAFNTPHAPFHRPPLALHSQKELPESGGARHFRAYYEAMIEAMDQEIGRLLQAVDLSRTTVIFLADNGTPGKVVAPPYRADRAKGTVYQDGIRVPLLIAGAGVVNPGRMVDGPVNTVDLYPTVLELAGIEPRTALPRGARIDGVSLLPHLTKASGAPIRTWAYAEKFKMSYDDRFQRAIRDQRYKLIERADGRREFYDLQANPRETANLLERRLTADEQASLRILEGHLQALLATR
jgi:arylsulfatase A-like enzyme